MVLDDRHKIQRNRIFGLVDICQIRHNWYRWEVAAVTLIQLDKKVMQVTQQKRVQLVRQVCLDQLNKKVIQESSNQFVISGVNTADPNPLVLIPVLQTLTNQSAQSTNIWLPI